MAKYVYEPEVVSAGVNNVVPSYATIDEAYFFLQEATENDWNMFTKDLGIYELGVLEATGSEVVYEADGDAAEKKSNGLIAFIKKRLEDFRGFIQGILQKLQAKINKAKEKLTNKVLAKVKNNLDAGRLNEINKDGTVKSFAKNYYTYKGGKYDLDKFRAKDSSELSDSLGGDTGHASYEISIDDFRGEKKESVDREYIVNNYEDIVKSALDFQFTKKSIVGPYQDLKQTYDQMIKDVKSGKSEDINKIKAKITLLNKNAAVVVKAFHERQGENLSLLLKIAVGTLGKSEAEKAVAKEDKEAKKAAKAAEKESKKAAKEEEVKESAPVVESYTTEIEKLFDWNF